MYVTLYFDPRNGAWSLLAQERRGSHFFAIEPSGDGGLSFREMQEGGEIKPLLVIPSSLSQDFMPKLAAELQRNSFMPADQQGALAGAKSHLADAQTTRDRLFTLVEKLTDGVARS